MHIDNVNMLLMGNLKASLSISLCLLRNTVGLDVTVISLLGFAAAQMFGPFGRNDRWGIDEYNVRVWRMVRCGLIR